MNKQFNLKALFCSITLVFIGFNQTIAQTKLSILYKQGTIKGSVTDYLKPNSATKWNGKFSVYEFAIADTISYYEPLETYEEGDEMTVKAVRKSRKNKIMGKSFKPNSIYCNYATGVFIEAIEWKDENYLVKDNISNKQKIWGLSEETKVVLGYPCKLAYTMLNGEKDLVVWYTENFKCSYSNNGDTSLPGTILETYIPKSNTLITAIDLQIETSPITLPKAITVTQEAFDKIKKNKKN